MQERNDMRGRLRIEVRDRDGNVVQTQECHNRIVLSGRYLVAHMFGGVPTPDPTIKPIAFLAVGEGAAAVTDDQTALVTERGPRKAIAKIDYTDFTDTGTKRVRATITATFDYKEVNGNAPLVEAGLFTDDNTVDPKTKTPKAGIMYNRVTFNQVNKNESFQLTLLWEIIF